MGSWKAPLLGRKVEIIYTKHVWDEEPKHWWNNGKAHYESYVAHIGEVVDRANDSAEYAVVCEDGKIRWVWSSYLRVLEK